MEKDNIEWYDDRSPKDAMKDINIYEALADKFMKYKKLDFIRNSNYARLPDYKVRSTDGTWVYVEAKAVGVYYVHKYWTFGLKHSDIERYEKVDGEVWILVFDPYDFALYKFSKMVSIEDDVQIEGVLGNKLHNRYRFKEHRKEHNFNLIRGTRVPLKLMVR